MNEFTALTREDIEVDVDTSVSYVTDKGGRACQNDCPGLNFILDDRGKMY